MQLQAFPIYNTLAEQFRFNPKLAGYNNFELYAGKNAFLPFLIYKKSDKALIDCIRIIAAPDTKAANDTQTQLLLPQNFAYKFFTNDDYDYLFYYGDTVTGLNLDCGKYYLEFSIADYKRYSEVFTVSKNLNKLLKIEYSSKNSIGYMTYATGWRQRVYLNAEISNPDYKAEPEETENGYGVPIIDNGTVKKALRIIPGDVHPEYLVDALSLLPLHEKVDIDVYQEVHEIVVQPTWRSDFKNALAQLEITFVDSYVLNAGCDNIKGLEERNTEDYTPMGTYCGTPGDTAPHWIETGEKRCQQVEVPEPDLAWRVQESSAYCVKM